MYYSKKEQRLHNSLDFSAKVTGTILPGPRTTFSGTMNGVTAAKSGVAGVRPLTAFTGYPWPRQVAAAAVLLVAAAHSSVLSMVGAAHPFRMHFSTLRWKEGKQGALRKIKSRLPKIVAKTGMRCAR